MNFSSFTARSLSLAAAFSTLLLSGPAWSAESSGKVTTTTTTTTTKVQTTSKVQSSPKIQIPLIYKSPDRKVASMPMINVPYRSWLPKTDHPHVVLFCIHGLGLSSKSFSDFGRRMAGAGIPTYAMDVRGFGGWTKEPEKAHVDFDACLLDVEQALKTLHQAYPGIPVFVVGESMGGAIAIQSAARYPDLVNGLISSVPSSTERASSFLKGGAIMVFESAENPTGKSDISAVIVERSVSNPNKQKRIKNEPLNRSKLSKGELTQFQRFMAVTHDVAPNVERTPALVLVAYKDKLVSPYGSIDLLSEMTSPTKLLLMDGNSDHLMLEEDQLSPHVERLLKDFIHDQTRKVVLNQGSRANVPSDKTWTTYERQVNLMKRINEAEKTQELTAKEARHFRKELGKIATEKQKLRDENVGKPENIDMSSIEGSLTKLSTSIDNHKQENIEESE